MGFNDNKSVQVCRVALKMAISSREEERKVKKQQQFK